MAKKRRRESGKLPKRSALYGVTKREITDRCELIKRQRIKPWRALAYGKPIEIKDYYGSTIHYQGVKFEGCPRVVFWGGHIEPFLEDAIEKILVQTAKKCREYQLKPERPIEEAVRLLRGLLIYPIYRCMAQTDQFLRGKEKKVRFETIKDRIEGMEGCLKEHRGATILLATEAQEGQKKKLLPTKIRIAEVIRKSPPMSSSMVAKLADTTAATVRNSAAWKNRSALWNSAGRVRRGSKDKNGGMEANGTKADTPQAVHYDIYGMIQDYKSGKTKIYPTPKQIAERLTTDDDIVSEGQAKQLLKQTKAHFPDLEDRIPTS